MEPTETPWQAVKGWIPDDEPDLDWLNRPRNPSESDPDCYDQSPACQPEEAPWATAASSFSTTPERLERCLPKKPLPYKCSLLGGP
jgi:hypothetical protein